jgi:hypothetical protein
MARFALLPQKRASQQQRGNRQFLGQLHCSHVRYRELSRNTRRRQNFACWPIKKINRLN